METITILKTRYDDAVAFVPASWELFGFRAEKHYSYNPVTANWDFTGWEFSPAC